MLGAVESEEETGAAQATRGLSSLSGVLAVQEVSDREGGRKRAVQKASQTLDVLEELRNALLLGEVPAHLLQRIAARIEQQKAATTDGQLLEVMREIEVRAAVELAKLERR